MRSPWNPFVTRGSDGTRVAPGWACASCTLENGANATSCEACGTARLPVAVARPAPSSVEPRPRTLEEFVRSERGVGEATMHCSVLLHDGTQLELTTTLDAEALRGRLRTAFFDAPPPAYNPGRSEAPPPAYKANTGRSEAPPRPNNPRGNTTSERTQPPTANNNNNVFRNNAMLPSELAARHAESFANAGSAGGEAQARGPRVDEAARSYGDAALEAEVRAAVARARAPPEAGSRVNAPTSHSTIYDRGAAFETEVELGPSRFLPLKKQGPKEPQLLGKMEEEDAADVNLVAVPFEVAAVGAKIRNLSRVAGQRVGEMDHFVAEVRTPIVEVSGEGGARLEARSAIERKLRDRAMSGEEVPVGSSLTVLVLDDDHSNAATFGAALASVLTLAFTALGWPEPCAESIRLYYLASIRADALVCSRGSPEDQRLYLNVLAFEQSRQQQPPLPSSEELPALVAYWVQRLADASRRTEPNKNYPKAPPQSDGLYDAAVRARLRELLNQVEQPRRSIQKPTPVPTTPLRRGNPPQQKEQDITSLRELFPVSLWDDAALRWLCAREPSTQAAAERALTWESAQQMRDQLNDPCTA